MRKHLSAIKGGRLALHCGNKTLYTYAISDVPYDDPSVIASGPTIPDSSTRFQALDILQKYGIDLPDNVFEWLRSAESETPKPQDFNKSFHYQLIAAPLDALREAAKIAKEHGINPLILGDTIEGEASEVAKVFAGIARFIQSTDQPLPKPCVILSGGETTVSVKGNGRGGRNAEFLLSLFNELKGHDNIHALACDTDGIDGTEDNAGALFGPSDWIKARDLALSSNAYLKNNDGYSFFEKLDRLIITGPTRTNVNDFRAILIL